MLRRALALALRVAAFLSVTLGLLVSTAAPAQAASPGGIPEAVIRAAPADTRPIVPEPPGGWFTEPGLYADVHSTWQDRATATRLANHAATSLPALAKRMGLRPGATTEIYVVDSEANFHAMQPGATPDWADGTAWPNVSLVFLKSPSIRAGGATALETVLDHELVHVLLGQAFGGRPVPRWLQEGYAQFYSGESSWERAMAIAHNEYGLAPLPLAEITQGFPKNAQRAQLAYAESANFVVWIRARGGEGALRSVVADLAAGKSVNEAITMATGLSLEQANEAWLGTVPIAIPWFRWATNPNLYGGLGAVALGVAAWRRRSGARAKLARWEAEDAARAAALLERQPAEWVAANEAGLQPWVGSPLPMFRPRRVEANPRWN